MSRGKSSGDTQRVAIEVRDLQKSFWIPHERQTMLKERALHPNTWLRGPARRLDALRGISFDVASGEFFGVVGRNGSGKSTLLKLLASIYRRDRGSIRVAGRLAPFIELGVGLNPELRARDNVVLNGVMMGLTPSEARSRFERVIDHAELWDYTDLKLKNYSVGMHVRLAFSMTLQVDADVLLVDEVLAVGDLAFQEKCIASLEEMKRRGVTVVLVTHDMDALRSHCDRAMLIEDGLIDLIGEPDQVAERFVEVVLPRTRALEQEEAAGGAAVAAAWLADSEGRTVQAVPAGEPISFNATVRAREDDLRLRLTVELLNHPEGVKVAGFPVGDDGEFAALAPGEEATVRVELDRNSLEPGEYRFGYELAEARSGRALDRCAEPLRLRMMGEDQGAGMVRLSHRVNVDRSVTQARR
jgi:ABC-type polysaccharide/polyol phosphate transport system ATPase subunit